MYTFVFLCVILDVEMEVLIMASKARLDANKRYQSKFDDIKIRVPSGERDVIKSYAEGIGKSLNSYIYDLIKADMSRDSVNIQEES